MPVALPLVVSNATECPSADAQGVDKVLYQHVGLARLIGSMRMHEELTGVQRWSLSVRKSDVCRCTRLPQRCKGG
jgi:hypothetical protein